MTISNELMLAILAMDSYNRGYREGISGLGGEGSQLGTATLAQGSDATPGGDAVTASFFAQAYTLADGRTVISYRGTDQALPSWENWTFGDMWNGWIAGAGFEGAKQARLAVEFYRSVAGQSVDPRIPNIVLTGHSLGGGLAGFVGTLYGKSAAAFDNMPFELAASNAYSVSTAIIPNAVVRDAIYGPLEPWSNSRSNVEAFAVTGEALAVARLVTSQQTPVRSIDSNGGLRNPVDLHSQALLTILLFGEDELVAGRSTGEWISIGTQFIDALFDNGLAQSAGAAGIPGVHTENQSYSSILLNTIAYSALDSGERPFGDSAIRAMFNDADELGRIYSGSPNRLLDDQLIAGVPTVKQGLAEIAVQYAGDLALQAASDAQSKAGVFELLDGGARLKADLDPQKWRATFNLGIGAGSKLYGGEGEAANDNRRLTSTRAA